MVEYLVGSVDNRFRLRNPPSSGSGRADVGFQMMATSLRGYDQAARYGNSYAVLSNEVRLPLVTTFTKRPVQSSVLKNLQLVAFADAGAGWNGWVPVPDSMVQTSTFPGRGQNTGGLNNIQLEFTKQAGFALGYGAGLRTALLGYFLRLDMAWNIEGGTKPIVYFALGTDF